ncbi:Cathepsin B-like cysteine proteinase [Carpediemonas membranifera]|uniref:Cathepsin B-like cysteine proteinase n=1 Tax=Carpediemonas membranifera TaxID=201153 RepID=A0A8J6B1G1_9EUKA|nr:Cathepsin B-like cysteine proteinase [Carpediemonas membranifera]|eukprot:KAG9390992.1 Cathepsin B-like cysteine proteinase [Carpediemonas membranifera]
MYIPPSSPFTQAAVAALNDRFCLKSGGSVKPRLSAEYHVQCDHECSYGVCNNGCAGGHYFPSYQFTNRYGTTTEACYPVEKHYYPYTYNCRTTCPGTPSGAPIPKYKTGTFYRTTGETAMVNELIANGPIPVAIRFYSGLYSVKPGEVYIKQDGESYRGGHAVVIVGYGVTSSGVKYWECANSWGTNYCDKGYFWIRRGSNELSIESYPCGVQPTLSASITMTAPSAGAALIVGKSTTVRWSSSGTVEDTVVIKLLKGTTTAATLATAAPNSGSYSFTVPNVAEGSDYSITVTCESAQGKTGAFSVSVEFSASITAPKAGAVIETGATTTFSWTISPTSVISLLPAAKLSLHGPSTMTLGTALPLDKSVSSLLPLSLKEGDYVARLTIGDDSFDSGKFEIQIGGTKTITVGKMSTSYETGTPATVTWSVSPDSTIFDSLTVTLVGPLSNGIGAERVLATVSNTGSFAWTPAESLVDGSYLIRVASVDKPSVSGSSNTFLLAAPVKPTPTLRMLTPTSTSVWTHGETATISWNTTGDVPYVTVELFNAGRLVATIASASVNTGTAKFTPSSAQTPADTYSVRVKKSTDSSVLALSGQFKIQQSQSATPTMDVTMPTSTTVAIPGKQTLVRLVTSSVSSATLSLRTTSLVKVADLSSTSLSDGTTDVSVTIPASTAAGSYRIQAYDSKTGLVSNSATFSVEAPTEPIELQQPTAASKWPALSVAQVRWSTADIKTPMTVVLYKGSTLVTVLARDATGGVFEWRVPDLLKAGTDYVLRVRTTASPYAFVDSPEFAVTADPGAGAEPLDPPDSVLPGDDDTDDDTTPDDDDDVIPTDDDDDTGTCSGICISSPKATTTWVRGATASIRWISDLAPTETLYILLYDGTSLKALLATNALNDGEMTVTVPSTLAASEKMFIRIKTRSASPTVTGDSDLFALSLTPVAAPVAALFECSDKACNVTFDIDAATVDIGLYKQGTLVKELATDLSNAGIFSIEDLTLDTGSGYTVRVCAHHTAVCVETEPFDVASPSSNWFQSLLGLIWF